MSIDFKRLNKVLMNDCVSMEIKEMIRETVREFVVNGNSFNTPTKEMLESYKIISK